MIMWILFALLSAFMAALVAIFSKIGISHIDSTLATTLRSLVMCLFLFLISGLIGKFKLLATVDTKGWLFITLAGLAGALSWLAYFIALRYGPVAKVASIDRLSIVFVIFLAVFIGEPLTLKSIVGAALLTLGALIISF